MGVASSISPPTGIELSSNSSSTTKSQSFLTDDLYKTICQVLLHIISIPGATLNMNETDWDEFMELFKKKERAVMYAKQNNQKKCNELLRNIYANLQSNFQVESLPPCEDVATLPNQMIYTGLLDYANKLCPSAHVVSHLKNTWIKTAEKFNQSATCAFGDGSLMGLITADSSNPIITSLYNERISISRLYAIIAIIA